MALTICEKMFFQTKKINSISFEIKKTERIEGKLITQKAKIDFNKKPFKVYVRQEFPTKGMEVLYNAETNKNEALVNTNGFPWVNLKLDPMGKTMRNNQHHTIFESGYDYVISILEFLVQKHYAEIHSLVLKKEDVVYNGYQCSQIQFINPYFKYIKYTAEKEESILDIAKRYRISEYMILEKNKGLSFHENLKIGQEIVIPNEYSPKMILYVCKQNHVPILMKVYDEKGLYEQYEYSNISINPNFAANEFTEDFEEYDF